MKVASKILPFLVVAMLFAVPAFAQTGSIQGRVLDQQGNPMEGALVSIDRQGISGHFEVRTREDGTFFHAGLPTGQYQVSVMQDDRPIATNPDVRVSFGGTAEVEFDLRVAAATASEEDERARIEAEIARDEAMRNAFEAGRTALAAGNFEDAARNFQMAADTDPTQHVIFANLADALQNLRKYDEAAEAYKKAIELNPEEGAYYNNLGIVYGNAGEIELASDALEQAAVISPTTAGQAYYNLGAVLTNRGRTADAAEAFKKAIEFNPDMAPAYYQLGISYFGSADTIPEAIPVLEKFLQLQPTGEDAEAAKQLIEAAKALQ